MLGCSGSWTIPGRTSKTCAGSRKSSFYGSISPDNHKQSRFSYLFGNGVNYDKDHNYEVPISTSLYHKSTSSLVRRTSSKVALGTIDGHIRSSYNSLPVDNSTPVLIAVRRNEEVAEDSNYFSSSSKDCSPSVHHRTVKNGITNQPQKMRSSFPKFGFLKFFHKPTPSVREKGEPTTSLVRPKKQYYEFANEKSVPTLLSASKKNAGLPPNFSDDGLQIELSNHYEKVLPKRAITANTSATFSAKEHLMFMLKRRRRGGKFTPSNQLISNNGELASSSMSSLNSNRPIISAPKRHHPKKNFRIGNSRHGHQFQASALIEPHAATSSTTSVNSTTSSTEEESGGIESIVGNGSNYDSGAFSRTSSPTDESPFVEQMLHQRVGYLSQSQGNILTPPARRERKLTLPSSAQVHATELINQLRQSLSASTSRLAMTGEPLHSPALVLAAISASDGIHEVESVTKEVDTALVWACLNAASQSSTLGRPFKEKSPYSDVIYNGSSSSDKNAMSIAVDRRNSTEVRGTVKCENNVSVTVGTNTMLTISLDGDKRHLERTLRRSRSGLPVLGTAGLSPAKAVTTKMDSPKQNITRRNRISTVYLQEGNISKMPASQQQPRISKVLERSDSLVTVMGSAPADPSKVLKSHGFHCECTEVVTVNGQHLHCPDSTLGRHPLAIKNKTVDLNQHKHQPKFHIDIASDWSITNDASSLCSSTSESYQPNSLIHI